MLPGNLPSFLSSSRNNKPAGQDSNSNMASMMEHLQSMQFNNQSPFNLFDTSMPSLHSSMNPSTLQTSTQDLLGLGSTPGPRNIPISSSPDNNSNASNTNLPVLVEPPLSDPQVRFASQITTLEDMGFTDKAKNIKALLAAGGNMEGAIAYLLGN